MSALEEEDERRRRAREGSARFVGVLMLDTRFPRLPGDVGHPHTFDRAGIPMRLRVIAGATPRRVVALEADARLVAPFVEAARELEAQGAALITTSCGFLAAHQAALQNAVGVPVLSSSLLWCRRLARCGIVTIDAAALGLEALNGAGVPPGTAVQGVDPKGAFASGILGNASSLDHAQGCAEVVAAARALIDRQPDLENIVLECTNMPPYRDAVAQATGRRVHDIETLMLDAWRELDRG
jgi:hypothetical protein